MAKSSLRSYLQLASGLGEVTAAKASEAAQELVAFSVRASSMSPKQFAKSVSTVADDLVRAANANRESLVATIRSEIEAALDRIGVARLTDLDSVTAALTALSGQIEDLAKSAFATVPGVGDTGKAPAKPIATAAPSSPASGVDRPSRSAIAAGAAATKEEPAASTEPEKAAPAKKAVPTKRAATGSTAKKSTAKKSTTKKATATKAATKKATATKSTAKKATTKKSVAKKSTAKKAATKKTSAATS